MCVWKWNFLKRAKLDPTNLYAHIVCMFASNHTGRTTAQSGDVREEKEQNQMMVNKQKSQSCEKLSVAHFMHFFLISPLFPLNSSFFRFHLIKSPSHSVRLGYKSNSSCIFLFHLLFNSVPKAPEISVINWTEPGELPSLPRSHWFDSVPVLWSLVQHDPAELTQPWSKLISKWIEFLNREVLSGVHQSNYVLINSLPGTK